MIESVLPLGLSLPKRAAPDGAEGAGFSYALASASLEANAGAALKAFGAEQGASEVGTPAREADAQPAKETSPARAPSPQPTASSATGSNGGAQPAAELTTPSAPPVQPAAAAIVVSATTAPVTAGAAPAAAPQSAPAGAARVELAARDAQARSADAAAKPKASSPPRSEQPAASEFARLLARKLENGATAFDLRLDPPELGRVAARLTVGDDGKAQLSLSFDSQTAHDLFRRDQGALRDMLLASGFDLGAGDLSYSYEAPREADAVPPVPAAFPSTQAPLFLAAYSRGAVDMFA